MEKVIRKKEPKLDGLEKLAKKKWMAAICSFMDGSLFPIVLGLVAFLFYALNLPVISLLIFIACLCFICLFCKDTRPAVAIAFLILLTFRYKDNAKAYLTSLSICMYVFFTPILLFSMIYRIVRHRVEWKKKTGLLSVGLLCVAFLTGGIFNEYYNLRNFGYVFVMVAGLFGCYAFFAFTMQKREDNLVYLARVCAVFICITALEVLEIYIRKYEWGTPLNAEWRQQLSFGWSVCTMVSEMMVFLLPAVFYLICKEKYGCYYWIVVAVVFAAAFFVFARNALLCWGIVTICGAILSCFLGNNKKINRWIVCSLTAAGILLLILLLSTGALQSLLVYFKQIKLGDNGRLVIWEKHLELFKENPINGVGFEAYRTLIQGKASKAHNNVLQMLTSTGIIGFALYLVHRVQTIYLIVKKTTEGRIFIGGCIGAAVVISVLSSTFFMPYFMIYYSIILLSLEKTED